MNKLIGKLQPYMPVFMHNLYVSSYNISAYRLRLSGNYKKNRDQFKAHRNLSLSELRQIQFYELLEIIKYAKNHSQFYQEIYKDIDLTKFTTLANLDQLPIIDKDMLRVNIENVHTIPRSKGHISKTGGTTGKSLEVIFTLDNLQKRFAMLDNFRGGFGYKLGKKTAWLSGKNLITPIDIAKNRFWKTDYWYRVRYYSTFHIKDVYLRFYVEDLIKYKPEFIVGFPSSILEIAKYGLKNKYEFPENTIKAIFPTAETITKEMRFVIESFFKTKMYNQYASSEGAPFIFECKKGNLHLELQSGVFEVLDNNDQPAQSGRLVITSFTTHGTPLIRYDIGDNVILDDATKECSCGNKNPMVKEILGRIDDYVFSPENGKINLGNVSNTLKDTKGIVKFQAIQNDLNGIKVLVVTDSKIYTKEIEKKFIQNWRDRVGQKMNIEFKYCDDIPVEKSGKYRIVKNNIKHLIN